MSFLPGPARGEGPWLRFVLKRYTIAVDRGSLRVETKSNARPVLKSVVVLYFQP